MVRQRVLFFFFFPPEGGLFRAHPLEGICRLGAQRYPVVLMRNNRVTSSTGTSREGLGCPASFCLGPAGVALVVGYGWLSGRLFCFPVWGDLRHASARAHSARCFILCAVAASPASAPNNWCRGSPCVGMQQFQFELTIPRVTRCSRSISASRQPPLGVSLNLALTSSRLGRESLRSGQKGTLDFQDRRWTGGFIFYLKDAETELSRFTVYVVCIVIMMSTLWIPLLR